VAAVYADAVRAAGIAPERLGAPISADPARDNNYPYQPIEPQLDLASDDVMPSRPVALPATADPAFAAIGARLDGILDETQKTTLAGFRLLDPHGVVIAGGGEVGQSL
ncbi:two-component sensor histidine kinase, partial [bacterium M00.F.Ca.ET.159.01.1.1]